MNKDFLNTKKNVLQEQLKESKAEFSRMNNLRAKLNKSYN